MNKEYIQKICEILSQIDDLAQPVAEAKKVDIPEETEQSKVEANHDTSKRYDPEFKKMVVHLHKEEKWKFRQITEKYGVSKATITKWCSDARYETAALMKVKEKEIDTMQTDYEKVKEENAFLKKIVFMMFEKAMGGVQA